VASVVAFVLFVAVIRRRPRCLLAHHRNECTAARSLATFFLSLLCGRVCSRWLLALYATDERRSSLFSSHSGNEKKE
jgi:hypothetical protein